jgi:integrase
MATIKTYIQKRKNDGTHRILIEITHNRQRAYIPTEIYVTDKDLTAKKHLKKTFYSLALDKLIIHYRQQIADMGVIISSYSASDIKTCLIKQNETKGGKYIDFIEFCTGKILELQKIKGKNGTYYQYLSAVNWLKKFKGDENLNILEINKPFVNKFEDYMRQKNVGVAGISASLRALRTLFIRAMDEYNDESKDEYIIKHYPFRNYKIKQHIPEKRSITMDIFKQVAYYDCTGREKLGCDMLLLSFLLAGIAPIDLYNLKEIKNDYIEYYRDKVKHRTNRIKVKIPVYNQAAELIKQYSKNGFLSEIKRYSTCKNFSRACAKGIKSVCEKLEVENMSLYWARHTFATTAAELGYDTNLIDYVLGHTAGSNKMAEIYITRTQSSVDKLVNDVVNLTIK